MQKILADHLGLAHKLAHRHALGLQRIKPEADIGVLVVDKGTEHAPGQVAGLVSKLLSSLIEFLLDGRGRRAVLQGDGQKGITGPRRRLDTIVPGEFLEALFERLGDQILHFARCRARPHRCHGQGLDGEGRVLGAPELDEGIGAGGGQQNDEEQGDGPLANGERG